MKKLYLLRHAKSEWDDPELDDFDRPLNERGRRNAQKMAAFLTEVDIQPSLILCSAAKRAAETCDFFKNDSLPVKYEDNLYLASAETLIDYVQRLHDQHQSVLIVAHNPGLEDLTLEYGRNGDTKFWQQVSFKYPTASIAELEIDSPSWSGFKTSNARLVNFVRPKDLSEVELADSSAQ